MTQVLFDTQSAVDDLKRGGFTDDQAKANVRFVREALEGGVATKADVTAVQRDLAQIDARLTAKSDLLETSLRGEMKAMRLQLTITILGASGLLGLLIRYLA